MVDRPPPSRFSVVERGGRLVVIDRETGQTPPTAAERMDIHDRKMGVEAIRPARAGGAGAPDMSAATRAESGLGAGPAPAQQAPVVAVAAPDNGKDRMGRNKRPWNSQSDDRPALTSDPAPARAVGRPAPQAGGTRKKIVTGKWWDSKGPRTIELGVKGQQVLSSGFVTLSVVVMIAAIVALFLAPVLLFAAAFLLFRFGGKVLGPIGASLIDKALAEKG